MKLISLARSKKEREEHYSCKPSKIEGPSYSYGTCLRFEKEELKKLGLSVEGLKVGTKFTISAIGEVKSVNQSSGPHNDSASVEIQVTKIGLEKKAATFDIDKAIKEANE